MSSDKKTTPKGPYEHPRRRLARLEVASQSSAQSADDIANRTGTMSAKKEGGAANQDGNQIVASAQNEPTPMASSAAGGAAGQNIMNSQPAAGSDANAAEGINIPQQPTPQVEPTPAVSFRWALGRVHAPRGRAAPCNCYISVASSAEGTKYYLLTDTNLAHHQQYQVVPHVISALGESTAVWQEPTSGDIYTYFPQARVELVKFIDHRGNQGDCATTGNKGKLPEPAGGSTMQNNKNIV